MAQQNLSENRLSCRPPPPEGRPCVQGVRLLGGDPSLLTVVLKEPAELEEPDRCEEVIVDRETLYMMKVCPLTRVIAHGNGFNSKILRIYSPQVNKKHSKETV